MFLQRYRINRRLKKDISTVGVAINRQGITKLHWEQKHVHSLATQTRNPYQRTESVINDSSKLHTLVQKRTWESRKTYITSR